jgi:hypothetical protein
MLRSRTMALSKTKIDQLGDRLDRATAKLVSIASFLDDQRTLAQDKRLALELELNDAGATREVVLLEAVDEAMLRRTHRRYFEDLSELANSPK